MRLISPLSMVLRILGGQPIRGMSLEQAAYELHEWAINRRLEEDIFELYGHHTIQDDLQKPVRWQPDTFPLSIEKHPTFVSIQDQFENIAASLNYWPTYDRSEIQQRCDRYWEALNATRRWRWQGNRPVRKLFQPRPVRTVIPGLGLTRRPAGRYYSGTRKAMNRKLAA